MTDRKIEIRRDLLQRDFPAEIGFELFASALHLPGRKTAAGQFGGALQPPIGLGNVRGEREHHVIDEELVGLRRPAQPFQERSADLANDRIVMTDAEFAGDLAINKTPKAWSHVPYVLRHGFNLEPLDEPLTIFDGPARECVAEFPQDVNIAAVLSLAGIGFDRTHIKIVAHPTVTLNTYEIEWEGFTGRSRAVYENAFDPNNPKTTYLAAISTLAALTRIRSSYRIGT